MAVDLSSVKASELDDPKGLPNGFDGAQICKLMRYAEEVAETMDGPTMQWMKEMAKTQDTAICGSLAIQEGNDFYNRFVFVHPSGYGIKICAPFFTHNLFLMIGIMQVVLLLINY
jgi:hypothetical protein